MTVLLLDNYDSFVHNLARLIRQLGYTTLICRSDKVTLDDIQQLAPSHIVISPGPKAPNAAGISLKAVIAYYPYVPIWGIK